MYQPTSSAQTHQKLVKIHRTPEQWQSIIASFEQSGLPAQAFCEQHNIAYSTFAKWRQKVSMLDASSNSPALSFIELPTLESAMPHTPWRIELELGGGVIVRLTR